MAMLSACAPSPPREKPVITVDDVDVITTGAKAIVRTLGQANLNKDSRIVCAERVPIGSHLSKVICMTREEMAVIKRESEEELLEIQDAQERFRESNPYNQ